ncbi:MAG: two-component regulator propeller domain-containing protein [Chitinophagaceae bacterium]
MKYPRQNWFNLFIVRSLCCVWFLVATTPSFSQSLQPTFIALPGSRSYTDIRTVLLDRKQFLWFGCNQGLVRFDGSNYIKFNTDTSSKSIPTDKITALFEDSNGNIWIGTADKGLFLYTHQSDSFQKLSMLGNFSIGDIREFQNQLVIIANKELYLADSKNKTASALPATEILTKEKISVIACLPDPLEKNKLWILSSAGLYNYHASMLTKVHNHSYSVDEIFNPLKTLSCSGEGNIYSAKKGTGLIEYSSKTNTTSIYPFSSQKGKAYTSNNIDALHEFDENNTLVSTQDSGLALFNHRKKKYFFFTQKQFPESDIYRFQVTAIVANKENMVLATQNKGIWVYNMSSAGRFTSIPVMSVYNKVPGSLYARSLFTDRENDLLYIGSFYGDGLYIYNLKTGKTVSYPFIKNITAASTLIVNCVLKDASGIIWVGTQNDGLLIFDDLKNQLIHAAEKFTGLASVKTKKIYCLLEDKENNLYIGTGGDGLVIANATRDNLSSYLHDSTNAKSILTNDIFAERFFEDRSGNIWISTTKGISIFNPDANQFYSFIDEPGKTNSIPKAFWYPVTQDQEGFIYIGTNEGIYKIQAGEKNLNNAKRLTVKDGLVHNNVYSIVKDHQGLLWMTCRNGISCYNPSDQSFRNFTYKNGLPAQTLLSPMHLSDDGIVYHGSVENVFYFNTSTIFNAVNDSKVWLTGLKISDKDSITGLRLNSIPAIHLSYTQHSFSFSYTNPRVYYPEAVRYSYMLEGVDKDWRITEERNYATYTNIKPGRYHFKVRTANADGHWSSDIKEISIEITPPFWQEWWFIALCGVAGFVAVISILKKREKNIKRREAEKTEIEKLRAANYQYQLEIEQVINFFATSISNQKTVDGMLWEVAKNCISKLGFEDCVIYLLDPDKNILVQKAAWGPKTTTEDTILNAIEIPLGKGIVGSVAIKGKPEIIGNTSNDSRYIKDDALRLSEIAVPMIKSQKVIGVIDSENPQLNFYTQRHLQILTTIASLCVDKIDKINAEQQTRDKDIEVLQLNKDLATSQLTALRAQMNPHFIFNALNSVQQYILQGNVDEANRYLSKFSKLQRDILNNSDQPFITLEKEKEILELYLQLEQLRFKDTFHYSIVIEEQIEPTEVKIPPMLIQPFIENAIWHGLMPKVGERRLDIRFDISDKDILECTIEDNGIGREAAEQLKLLNSGNTKHQSRGMNLVYDRLKILRQQYLQPFEVAIETIKDKDNNVAGTLVSVSLFAGY